MVIHMTVSDCCPGAGRKMSGTVLLMLIAALRGILLIRKEALLLERLPIEARCSIGTIHDRMEHHGLPLKNMARYLDFSAISADELAMFTPDLFAIFSRENIGAMISAVGIDEFFDQTRENLSILNPYHVMSSCSLDDEQFLRLIKYDPDEIAQTHGPEIFDAYLAEILPSYLNLLERNDLSPKEIADAMAVNYAALQESSLKAGCLDRIPKSFLDRMDMMYDGYIEASLDAIIIQ